MIVLRFKNVRNSELLFALEPWGETHYLQSGEEMLVEYVPSTSSELNYDVHLEENAITLYVHEQFESLRLLRGGKELSKY